MRSLAVLSLALTTLGLMACPQDTGGGGRDLPANKVDNVANPAANPGLKPVTKMPDFGQGGAASAPGTVVKNPASMPGPGTVIPGITPPAADTVVAGEALEVHQVKEYTYVRIKTATEEVWAAVPKSDKITVGAQVKVQRDMWMSDFQSPSLGRSFKKIAFGNLL